MIDLSDKSVLVYDYFSYVEIAERLGRSFGKVYYYCPYVIDPYPTHVPFDIGRNVPGVIKVKEWASVIDEVDMVYCTYSHEPNLQQHFKNLGKPVFGSVFADQLEHDRGLIKRILKENGLPVGNYAEVTGLDELEQILLNSGDQKRFVKSSLRGDMETWEHKDYRLSKRELKRLRHEMGLYENSEKYIIEHPLDAIAEIGYDGFCINGDFPDISLCGIEIKNCCYVGTFVYYNTLPEQIRAVNSAFSPIFRDMGYQAHYSNEIMITKDKRGFLLDNTNRCPQPNTSLAIEMYKNYPEIAWNVANGRMPYIEYEQKWGCQFIIKSVVSEDMPSPILVPEEMRRFVKMSNLSIDEQGTWWYVPSDIKNNDIGSVVGLGNTMDEAIKNAKQVAESIQGFDTSIKMESVDKVKKQMDKLNKAGISFI